MRQVHSPPVQESVLFEGMVSTKIVPPRLRPSRVSRMRLVERFGPDSEENVVIVSAPAGFGKTTLLAEWAERNRQCLGWVSLDEADNDPSRFWSYVGAALVNADCGVTIHGIGTLPAISEISIEHALAPLLAELSVAIGPVTLILDDYHAIASERVHASMAFLLDHLPYRVRVVFGSRSDLPFPTSRMRAQGRLIEVHGAGLAFTEAEASDLFRTAINAPLPPAQLRQILRDSEGWPMGLRAAAIALSRAQTGGAARVDLDNIGPNAGNPLLDVFAGQAPEVKEFLVRTSFLDRLSAKLCDFVLERSDSGQILDQLERSDAFVTSLDDSQTWFRLHPLVAPVLKGRFDRLDRAERIGMHRRASEWLASEAQWEAAIRHSLEAEEWAAAIGLIARLGRFMIPTNRPERFRSWLSRIPRAFLIQDPYACVQLARSMMFGNLHSAFESLLEIADQAYRDSGDALLAASISNVRSQAECFRGNQQKGIELAESGIALLPESETLLRGMLLQNQAVCLMLSDRVIEAEAATMQSFQKSISAGNALTACLAVGMRSFLNLRRGRVNQAYRYLTHAEALADSGGLRGLYILPFYRSRIQIECLRMEEAEASLREAEDTFDRTGNRIFMCAVHLMRARLHWMRGNYEAALESLAICEEAQRALGGIQDLFTAASLRLKIAMDRRDWPTVERLLEPGRPLPGFEDRRTQAKAAAALAAQRGDRAAAMQGVTHLLDLAKTAVGSGLGSDAVACYSSAAALQARHGTKNAALGHLMRAIRIASHGRLPGPFWEERASLRELLEEASFEPAYQGFVNELTHRLYLAPDPLAGTEMPHTLSSKESVIVRLLSQGHSNEEIAELAGVSPNTVKTHLKHIYAKLDVSNRTQAVQAARALGVL